MQSEALTPNSKDFAPQDGMDSMSPAPSEPTSTASGEISDTGGGSKGGKTDGGGLRGSSRSRKRKDAPLKTGRKPVKKAKGDRHGSGVDEDGGESGNGSKKKKRVRTGCLTCRDRHLKCDEATPQCRNCAKSNRTCRWGLRLNFIDTWAEEVPEEVARLSLDVSFQDESRAIASEYKGGLERYSGLEEAEEAQNDKSLVYDFPGAEVSAPVMLPEQALPSVQQGLRPDSFLTMPLQPPDVNGMYDQQAKQDQSSYPFHPLPNSGTTNDSRYGGSNHTSVVAPTSMTSYDTARSELHELEKREYLDNQDETLFMQVFIEEVGLWMDSMDPQKHFSRLLPFHALSEPMLLNAFLACGARHLVLVNPAYSEEKPLHYYDTATRYLLKNLQDPNRDTVICATTAVILNVYEVMSERALQRMNHIAGARALIKECGWNAKAQGIGGACFWLNVGLEVLSCLRFNWQVAWDPDDWGLDMDFHREIANGREEVWTHRMLYIMARVCNFRATIPRDAHPDPREQQARTQQRFEEYTRIKGMVDAWNDCIPRTMQPMAFLYPHQTTSKSAFPEVWLVKRATVVARLLYHTAQLMLAQVHPYLGAENAEMVDLAKRHSNMICGIVAHVKDRGVASVAIRSLAHAAEVLTDRREQEEVLEIFAHINKETGWKIGFVYNELKTKWGWTEEPSQHSSQCALPHHPSQKQQHDARQRQMQEYTKMTLQPSSQSLPPPPPVPLPGMEFTLQPGTQPQPSLPPKRFPSGIPNPLYAKADFNLPQHPYMNVYVPPNTGATNSSFLNGLGNGHGGGAAYYGFQ